MPTTATTRPRILTITRPDMQTWLLSVVLGTYNMMVLLARGR